MKGVVKRQSCGDGAQPILPPVSEPSGQPTFGQWLKARREERGLSLRDVERISNRQLSNAYVCQLEGDQVDNPSVVKLHILSAALGLDFGDICQRACVGEKPSAPDFCPTCGQVLR